jgi:hypothetical protein
MQPLQESVRSPCSTEGKYGDRIVFGYGGDRLYKDAVTGGAIAFQK